MKARLFILTLLFSTILCSCQKSMSNVFGIWNLSTKDEKMTTPQRIEFIADTNNSINSILLYFSDDIPYTSSFSYNGAPIGCQGKIETDNYQWYFWYTDDVLTLGTQDNLMATYNRE